MDNKLNIIVVDDDRASTHCLLIRLKKMKQIARLDTAESAQELLQKYLTARHYDIVYLDQLMPGMDGNEAAAIIKEKYPRVSVMFHTATNDMDEVRKIFKAKPMGWLWKDFLCSDAELSVTTVMNGHHFYSKESQEMLDKLIEEMTTDESKAESARKLSQRKAEVLKLYCRGMSYKEIGNTLCIDERTVETHMNEIHRDTHRKTRAELIELAMREHIIPRF